MNIDGAAFILMRWLDGEFLGHGDRPKIPDGSPLYAYRCTDAELTTLQDKLSNAFRMAAPLKGRYLSGTFCLYAAEWWKRNYEGGAWAWEPIFSSLGRPFDFPTAHSLTEVGLKYWRRPLRNFSGCRQFLFSLVLESGFPLRIVEREHGRLRSYLIQVLDELDRAGGEPGIASVIAEGAAAMLPAKLRRKEIYEIVGQLLAEIIACRRSLPDMLDGRDPVDLLDVRREGWRERLPLSIDDGPARSLIQTLLKESVGLHRQGQLLSKLCQRMLVRSDKTWRGALSFTMKGVIAPTLLSNSGVSLNEACRARLFANGALAEKVVAPLALLRPSQEDSAWRIEPLSGALKPVDFSLDQVAEMAVMVDGRQIALGVLPGGKARRDGLLVFQEDDGVSFASSNEDRTNLPPSVLRLAGVGSLRSRRLRLFVAIDPTQVAWQLSPGSSIQLSGSIEGTGQRLFEIRGTVTFTGHGDDLPIRVSTSVETEASANLLVGGRRPPWKTTAPDAVIGAPRVLVIEGEGPAQRVEPGRLRWRPWGERTWRPFPGPNIPFGDNEIALVAEGALVDRARLVVFPEGAYIEVRAIDRQCGSICAVGMSNAVVTLDHMTLGDSAISKRTELEPDGVEFAFQCLGMPPPNVRIDLRWQSASPVTVELPFPARGAGFIDSNGNWLRPNEILCVEQLYGVRGRALGCGQVGARLLGALYALDVMGNRPFIWRPFRDEISLSSLKPAFHRLFAASKEVDAEIRLEIDSGAQAAQLRIRRFDVELQLDEEYARLSPVDVAELEAEGHSPVELAVRGLASISDEEVVLRPLPGDHPAHPRWRLSDATGLQGPRLLYGRIDSRYRIRPRILSAIDQQKPDVNEHPGERFVDLIRISDRGDRIARMVEHFRYLAQDLGDPDWREIDAAREILQGRLPLTTLDCFDVIIGIPEALITFLALSTVADRIERVLSMEDELPFLWILLPLPAWKNAFARYRKFLLNAVNGSMPEAGAAEALAAAQISRVLEPIAFAEPVLEGQLAVIREYLGLPAAVGTFPPSAAQAREVQEVLRFQLARIRQECFQRNEASRWPADYAFRELIGGMPADNLVPGAGFRTATLDAPYAAARIAADALAVAPETMQRIREFREFDPIYFDGTYVPALILSLTKPEKMDAIA